MEHPGVSVIIPAFRAEDHIVRSVRSVLENGLEEVEVVVVSDDLVDYHAILQAAGLTQPNIKHTTTGRRGAGQTKARNTGLDCAFYPLVAPLDADDRLLPGRLAAMAPLAWQHGVAYDNVTVVRDRDDSYMQQLYPESSGHTTLTMEKYLKTSIPMFPVFRKDLGVRWAEDFFFCDDQVLNIQLLTAVEAAPLLLTPGLEYRQREGSITFSSDSGSRAERDYVHMLERLRTDGLGLKDEARRAAVEALVGEKRARNLRYEAMFQSGRVRNFQEFLLVEQGQQTR